MFQKLFLPAAFYIIFVKKQGKSLMMTKLHRDQQNIAQNIRQSIEQHLL